MSSNVAAIEKLCILVIMGLYFKKQIHLKNILGFGQKYWMPQFMVYICCIKICQKHQNMLYYSYFR